MAFGKIFTTMWEGSLMGQGGRDAVSLFAYMCAAADKHGYLRIAKTILGQRAGFNQHDPEDWAKFKECLTILEEPDPESNIPDHNGRRVRPLKDIPEEPDRRGWLIVNYKLYLYKASAEDKQLNARIRKERYKIRESMRLAGSSKDAIEQAIVLFNQSLDAGGTPRNALERTERHIDIDIDINKRLKKPCEACSKDFMPLEKWFTKCPACFKSEKEIVRPHPIKKCPNPACTIESHTQYTNTRLQGCNYCKPDLIGDHGETLTPHNKDAKDP
jgi:hypothetical protein